MKEKSLNLGKTKRADIYPQFTADINKLGEMAGLIKRGDNEQSKSKFQN